MSGMESRGERLRPIPKTVHWKLLYQRLTQLAARRRAVVRPLHSRTAVIEDRAAERKVVGLP